MNPFLINMPIVYIVRTARTTESEELVVEDPSTIHRYTVESELPPAGAFLLQTIE